MFDHPKFNVKLTIEKVTRIPYSVGHVFVRWNVTDSPRPDAHGRTVSRRIAQSEVHLNYEASFHQRIGTRSPNRELKACTIKFEVMWDPEGGHAVALGTLSLNLAEFASKQADTSHHSHRKDTDNNSNAPKKADYFVPPPSSESNTDPEMSGAYGKNLMYILSGARTNSLLQVKIEVAPMSSEADFTVPLFCGPAINFSSENVVEDETTGRAVSYNGASDSGSREKIRALRTAVLNDLRKNNSKSSKVDDSQDLDIILMGKTERVESEIPQEEFEKYHIRDLGTNADIVRLKEVRPYQEIEIRDTLATWGQFK